LPHVVDDLRALRGVLRRLKRDLGVQCLSVVEVDAMANKQSANKILERMRTRRLELCVYRLFNNTSVFVLSDGERIPENIGQLLIKDRRVIATGESSFRYVGS
jgi:hypothetical protein